MGNEEIITKTISLKHNGSMEKWLQLNAHYTMIISNWHILKCSINLTNVINVKVCKDVCLLHFHAKTTKRIYVNFTVI